MLSRLMFRAGVALLIMACGLLFLPHVARSQNPAATQTIESDNPQVLRTGTWTSQSISAASKGSYLFSSGSENDVLGLSFVGKAIEVVYVAGPNLGTFAIEVDGTVLRTVMTSADQTLYQQLARVDYLSDEPHNLKVYAQPEGVIAIDAFVIIRYTSAAMPVAAHEEGGIQSSTCVPLHTIHRVSQGIYGEATDRSTEVDISPDGRYVVFRSLAPNLVLGDSNGFADVFLFDRQTCKVSLVSVNSSNVQANSISSAPAISADGRYVVFTSYASNLDGGGVSNDDVFLRDLQLGTTTLISVALDGEITHYPSTNPAISANGRYVAYTSAANNLVPDDTNATTDIFVRDTKTNVTTRVSVATGGAQGVIGGAAGAAISADGRYVAFQSGANNLVSDDTNVAGDIFVHDRDTNTTTRVSVATDGTQSNEWSSYPAISSDGRYVAFESRATNLVADDTNGFSDIFVHDRQTNITSRISVGPSGVEANGDSFVADISGDGRYVVFQTHATNLIPGASGLSLDVYIHDRQTGLNSLLSYPYNGTGSSDGDSIAAAISADGRYVTYQSLATNLVPGDTNNVSDIFVSPRTQVALETLALFSPPFQQVNVINSLSDNPPASAYTAFSAYAPPTTPGQWVMGDWNADGLDTPGVYANGAFFFTNVLGESAPANWGGFWIGVNGPPVAGRFSNAVSNDCVGVVDSASVSGVTIFALYFTCDLSGTSATPPLTFQWLSSPLPDPTFIGTHQFSAGDFDGDGLDSIAVRRNEYIAYGNVNPAAGPAVFDLAQYIGAPGTGDNGLFVVGDWDANGADSFGLFYQDGELFYRNDLDFNSGVYENQSVGTPFGNAGVQVATWR